MTVTAYVRQKSFFGIDISWICIIVSNSDLVYIDRKTFKWCLVTTRRVVYCCLIIYMYTLTGRSHVVDKKAALFSLGMTENK